MVGVSEQLEQRCVLRPAGGVNWSGVMSVGSQSGQTGVPCWSTLLGIESPTKYLLYAMLEMSQQGIFAGE